MNEIHFHSLQEYAMNQFLKSIQEVTENKVEEYLDSSIKDICDSLEPLRYLLIKDILQYDPVIEHSRATVIFENAILHYFKNYKYTNKHFLHVMSIQESISYYCQHCQIICQRLIIESIGTLLLNFESLGTYLSDYPKDHNQTISLIYEMNSIISRFYPWRIEELRIFIAERISTVLEENNLLSFIKQYASWLKTWDSAKMEELKKYFFIALNVDVKNVEKVAKWICKMSEDNSDQPSILASCCLFLNNIFDRDSKYDELLWNIYKTKYFLRSIIKSVGSNSAIIEQCGRLDQRLFSCGLLNSIHVVDLRELNKELISSLALKRSGCIIPIILKQASVSGSLENSEITGLVLPKSLSEMIEKQWRAFNKLDSNKKKTLSLEHQLNLLELKSPFTVGDKNTSVILHVNLLQACIFELFNKDSHFSLENIKKCLTTEGTEIPLIEKNIEMFCEMNMMKQNDAGEYFINSKYKPKSTALSDGKLTLYHFPKISNKLSINERTDTKWYKELIGACIIRTLKERKKMTKTKLLERIQIVYPGISRGEFMDALNGINDYYTVENGNLVYKL